MPTLIIPDHHPMPSKVNEVLLGEELKARIGDHCSLTCEIDPNGVVVKMKIDCADSSEVGQARGIVTSHAPQKTAKEAHEEKESKRKEYLNADKIQELEARIAALEAA